jgi:UPF0716 protein FxsA
MLFLLFVLVPLVELYLLVFVAKLIGFWATVALTLVTGTIGASLARREGLRVLHAYQSALTLGRRPEQGIVDGLLVLVGGAFLITPGVLTDVTGVLLLLPPTRRLVAAQLKRYIDRRLKLVVMDRSARPPVARPSDPGARGRSDFGDVVDTSGESLSQDSEND